MFKKSIYFLCVLFLNFSFGQNIETQKAINTYVSQVNSCVYYISLSHYVVKDYNVEINERFQFPEKHHTINKVFDFYGRDIASVHNTKLNVGYIINQHQETIEKLEQLNSKKGEQLIQSLQGFQKLFEEFVAMNINFNNKNSLNNYYFNDAKNYKILTEELEQYKLLVSELRKKVDAISELSMLLYNEEKLPKAIAQSKQIALTSKKVIHSFREKNQLKIESSINELHHLLQKNETAEEQLELQNSINYPLTNPKKNGAGNRELIKSMAQRLYKKAVAFKNGENPKYQKEKNARFQYYTKKDAFQQMLKVEALLEWLNDDFFRSATVLGNYNHVTKVKTPILKIVNMLIPFEILPLTKQEQEVIAQVISEPVIPKAITPIVVENNSKTLEGAKTNNLVLLIDVSGSMKDDRKLEKLKASINHLITLLRKEDVLSVIVFSEQPKVIFSAKGNYKKSALIAKINQLKSGGKTNAKKGLLKAYNLCEELLIPNGNNRIIIATDGLFKLDKSVRKIIKKKAKKDISLSTFNYQNSKAQNKEVKTLQKMAKLGNGVYKLIKDDKDALEALIGEAKQ